MAKFLFAQSAENKGYVDTKDDESGYFNVTIDLSNLGESDDHYYWSWSGTDDHGQAVGSQRYVCMSNMFAGFFKPLIAGKT